MVVPCNILCLLNRILHCFSRIDNILKGILRYVSGELIDQAFYLMHISQKIKNRNRLPFVINDRHDCSDCLNLIFAPLLWKKDNLIKNCSLIFNYIIEQIFF